MTNSIFDKSILSRDEITREELKEIANYYKMWSKDVLKYFDRLAERNKNNPQVLEQTKIEYKRMQKEMKELSRQLSGKVEKTIIDKMKEVANNVLDTTSRFLQDKGLLKDLNDRTEIYLRIPIDVVNRLLTGKVYANGFNLSSSIWCSQEKTHKDIYTIIAHGRALLMPVKDIVKDIERYLNPNKSFLITLDNGQVLTKKKLDYNAKRLVRTLNQHTYQQSLVEANRENPFINSFIWIANGPNVCPLCEDRDGEVYKLEDLPLDHPNGYCVMEPVIADDIDTRLANWVVGEEDKEIDNFVDFISKSEIEKIRENVYSKIFY